MTQDGETVYSRGFGYSDVENNVKAHAHTLVRIASISKPITCAIAAKLIENNKLNIDASVNSYLNFLPAFKFENRSVSILHS